MSLTGPQKTFKARSTVMKMPRHFLSPPFISFIFLFNPSGGTSGGPRLKPKSRPQWGRRCGETRGPLLGVRLCSTSWQRGESLPSDICIVQPCVCIVNTCSGSCLFVQHAVSSSLPRWGMKRLMKSMSHILHETFENSGNVSALKRLLTVFLSQVCTHTVRAVAFSIPLSRL